MDRLKTGITGTRYAHIRHAVNDANVGDVIVVSAGIYHESIAFHGKNLILRSTNPNDPEIVAATIIDGGEQAVTFFRGRNQELSANWFHNHGCHLWSVLPERRTDYCQLQDIGKYRFRDQIVGRELSHHFQFHYRRKWRWGY